MRRWIGVQTAEEREKELFEIKQRETWDQIEKSFGIDGLWHHLSMWWRFGFLYQLGLHVSLIESIHQAIGPSDGMDSVELLEEARYGRFYDYD